MKRLNKFNLFFMVSFFLLLFSFSALAEDYTYNSDYKKEGYHLVNVGTVECSHDTDKCGYVTYNITTKNPSNNDLKNNVVWHKISGSVTIGNTSSYSGVSNLYGAAVVNNVASGTPNGVHVATPYICPNCGKSGYKYNYLLYSYCDKTGKWYYNGGNCNYGSCCSGCTPNNMDVTLATMKHNVTKYRIEPNTYSIKYEANGGQGTMANSTHTYDMNKSLSSNLFHKVGYSFVGWNTVADGSGTYYSNSQSVKNLTSANGGAVTLYAIWSAGECKLTFDAGQGQCSVNYITSIYDSKWCAAALPTPSRNGYTFAGWYTSATGGNQITNTTICKGDMTVYAHWNINYYYIDLNALLNGSTNGSMGTYGTCDVYINGTLVADDVSDFYAKYPYGTGYELRDIRANPGYKYEGVNSGSQKGSVGEGNVSIVLKLSKSKYKISYELNGGSADSLVTSYDVESDDVNLPIPSKSGYTFIGWTGSNGTSAQLNVKLGKGSTGDKKYTANWSANEYKYTLIYNDGRENEIVKCKYDAALGSLLITPRRQGYTFIGWNTKADGSGNFVDADTVCKGDMTVYAQWQLDTFNITVPKTVVGDKNGNASFIVKSELTTGKIELTYPTTIFYKTVEKCDVLAQLAASRSTLTPIDNKTVFTVKCDGLSAGSWHSNFNITIRYNSN